MPTSMEKNLLGKTVLITGASSGIGRSTAFEFARTCPTDLKLILTARRIDRLHQIADEIKKEVGDKVKIHNIKLDVSKPEEVSALVESLPEDFKEVDVLVNNAGFMSGVERPPDLPQQVIQDVWATNVTGVINMTQAILPIFKKRPDGGKGDIIMLGSIAGREPYVGGTLYCSSKAAIRAFTDALRKELIATKIRVITVDPGQVLTEFTTIRYRGDQKQADAVYAGCDPLTPDDVAEVIVFSAGRRENVVVADTLLFPTYQSGFINTYTSQILEHTFRDSQLEDSSFLSESFHAACRNVFSHLSAMASDVYAIDAPITAFGIGQKEHGDNRLWMQ